MTILREAVQQFVADYDCGGCGHFAAYAENFRKLLAQEEQATGKDPLQVDPKGGMQIATPLPLTTTDLAWLETRRLVRVWKELGQIRWAGADQGWDRAIEAVRARLDKECQDVLAWKEKVEASGQTAAQLLQKLRGVKDE
jgi:hypothetical protein